MTTLSVRQSVADFDSWKSAFDGHSDIRRGHGATSDRVFRDGNDLLVLIEFPDTASAQAFLSDPSLADAKRAGGVEGMPEVKLLTEVGREQF